jgi:hypothetical protein
VNLRSTSINTGGMKWAALSRLPFSRFPFDDIRFLVSATLVLAWIAEISLAEGAVGGIVDLAAPKSMIYYISHAGSILLGLLSGFLALMSGAGLFLKIGARLAMAGLFLSAAIWAAAAYTPREILSPLILGATGPFVWIMLIFTVCGASIEVHRATEKVVPWLAMLTAAFALRMLLTAPVPDYSFGLSMHTAYALLMMWVVGWSLLGSAGMSGFALVFRLVPYLVMVPVAIVSQSRSWTLLTLLLGVAWTCLRIAHQGWLKSAFLLALLSVGGVLAINRFTSHMSDSDSAVGKLADRLGDDTRSGQYVDFFADVKPAELLVGRGPKGTWYWTDVGDYQFIDNGYLWMLFLGGVPLLLAYFVLQVLPAIPLLRHVVVYLRQGEASDAACICMLIFWGLALGGLSTFNGPALALPSFLVALWAGRCHRLLHDRALQAATKPLVRRFAPSSPSQLASKPQPSF